MAFLVPEPVVRQKRTKVRQNCDKTLNNSSIFDRIRDLCRVPNPIVESIDETLFVSSVFDNIRELCRRPALLTTIDEDWIEEQKNVEEVVETKVWQKNKKQNYSDSNEDNTKLFETLCKSKLFASLVRGRHKSVDNLNVIPSDDSNSQTICENNTNKCKKVKKRSNVKSCAKSKQNTRKPLKPLLTIDCDISSMITEYSKQQSIPKKRTYNRKKTKICETIQTSNGINSSQESVDSGISLSYESMSSPSVSSCNNSYSMPATPVSSTDSQLSQSSVTSYETTSTTSVLSQIRRSLNPKYETYGQYIQRCIQNETKVKTKSSKRGSKRQNPDFKEKVLEWSKKLCSGNTTPIHNIEYLETPPGSPQITNVLTNDELNAMIDSLENKDFIETNDNLNREFNSLLSDLYSDFPMDIDFF